MTFLQSLEKWPKFKNDQPSFTLGGFLGVGASSGGSSRLSWEGSGSYVGRCWLQDGVFLTILGDVVASWCQDGARERQAETRWANLGAGSYSSGRDPWEGSRRVFSKLDTPEGVSRLRLQLELDLENWRIGGLEDLENRRTGGLDDG